MMFGLPAFLLCIGSGLTALAALSVPRSDVIQFYEKAAEQRPEEDAAGAKICDERLTTLDPENERFRFRLGEIANQEGDKARARALIGSLAPRGRTGYPPAHLWVARELLAIPSNFAREAAEGHLLQVLDSSPNSPEALALLAQIYIDEGRIAQAEKYLLQIGKDRPDLRISLARLYQAKGEWGRARAEALTLIEPYRRLSEARPEDQVLREQWAESLALAGDFQGAERILRDAMSRFPGGNFGLALARMYERWAESVVAAGAGGSPHYAMLMRQSAGLLSQYAPLGAYFQIIQGFSGAAGGNTQYTVNKGQQLGRNRSHPRKERRRGLVGKVSLDRRRHVLEDIARLLPAAFDHRQHRLDETAAAWTLSAKG
jgi:tetratricopeptide (TPR) repeat protein